MLVDTAYEELLNQFLSEPHCHTQGVENIYIYVVFDVLNNKQELYYKYIKNKYCHKVKDYHVHVHPVELNALLIEFIPDIQKISLDYKFQVVNVRNE